ncbi:MAG: HAD-IIB family hydrolase [Pseudomonadota bacterium]
MSRIAGFSTLSCMDVMFVTDLDGTLLDHETYSHDAAIPALDALRKAQVPLIMATSKTASEVALLRSELGLGGYPAIVENGAGVLWTSGQASFSGADQADILERLGALPREVRQHFVGFSDMSDAEVGALTGLDTVAAARARARAFSEPGLWNGSDAALAEFKALLLDHGIHARRGGRFLTLSHGRSKADAMRDVAQRLNARVVIALGDAPNDTEMLEAADIGVIIKNTHGAPLPTLKGEAEGRVRRSAEEGPTGWNTMVLQVLSELKIR